MSIDEMFKDFEFNNKPATLIKSVNGLELPEDYLSVYHTDKKRET